MPLVRISLPKSLSPETKENISAAIHSALMQEFNVPQDDYFHVIDELEPAQIKYPQSYLGIAHTPNIIFIQIIAGMGRTKDQKAKLYAKIAVDISETTEILKSDIIIALVENNGSENWSFGNGLIQELTHLKKQES